MSSRCRSCPPVPDEVRHAEDLVGRRWAVGVIYAAAHGALRFNEFRSALPGVPPATLSERLAQFERAGVVTRVVLPTRPPQVEYRLTVDGERLARAVDGLRRWAAAAR
jgi:DNA-binding HxlR family transcriptional regulator